MKASQIAITYASEADVLNVALFGKTAREWRDENPDRAKTENIRDTAAIEELIAMSNLESLNAELIKWGWDQRKRLLELNRVAREQLESLLSIEGVRELKTLEESH